MSDPIRRVAVVGGGPAGVAAAYRLQRAGVQVTLYEAEPWMGGRTRTDHQDGYRVDAGAQLFGSMFTRFFALVGEAGLGAHLVRSPGRDALFRGGRAYEVVYGSPASMLASGGLPLGTKLKLGTTYLPFLARHGASLDLHAPERAAAAGLDGESIASWGRREMGDDFVEYLVYPQLAAYYGTLPEETSAGLYHILARTGVEVTVHAVRGGTGLVCEAIAERVRRAGGAVHLGRRVEQLFEDASTVRVATAGGTDTFDGAVLAVPAPVALRLLADPSPALRGWLERVRFRPAITVALLLDRPLGVRYFGLSMPRSEARAVVAACASENKGAGLVPEGKGLLLALARPDVVPELIEQEPQRVLDAMLPDLVRAFPGVERSVVRARLYRWPVGNPVIYPGYLAHLGRARAEPALWSQGRVVLAGDYLYGASVEGAVCSGEDAATLLLSRWRRPV